VGAYNRATCFRAASSSKLLPVQFAVEMRISNSESSAGFSAKLFRIPLLINFALLLLLVGPGTSRSLDRAIRAADLQDYVNAIIHVIQTWVIASSLFSTVIFVRWRFLKKTDSVTSAPRGPSKADVAMLLGWWALLGILFLYALSMRLTAPVSHKVATIICSRVRRWPVL
jgi:hypothetical protein